MRKLLIIQLVLLLFSNCTCLKSQTIQSKSTGAYKKLAQASGVNKIDLLLEIAHYRLQDTIQQASVMARRAVEESKLVQDPERHAKSLQILTAVQLAKNLPDSAAYYNGQAGLLIEKNKLMRLIATHNYHLGKIMFSRKLFAEALKALQKAANLAEPQREFVLLGSIFLAEARIYKILNRKELIRSALDKSNEFFMLSNDPIVVGPLLLTLGVQYLDLAMTEKASSLFIKSIEYCENSSDSLHLGYAYINVSTIYSNHGIKDISDQYYDKSLSIFRSIGHDMGIAYDLNMKAVGYINEKRYTQALPLLSEAGILKKKAKDWQGACFVYSNLCELNLLMKLKEDALKAISIAEEMYRQAGDKLSLAAFLESKGKYLSYCKEFDSSLVCFNQSILLARELHVQGIEEENLLAISEMYQAKGDAQEALRYYKSYVSHRDSLQKTDNIHTIAEVAAKYESDKKDQQISRLLKSVVKTERGINFIVGNVVAVLLLLFAATIFFFRLKGNFTERLQFMLTIREKVNLHREKAIEFLAPVLPDKASKPIFTAEMKTALWQQLEEVMKKERRYLDPDLTMAELARRLNTNTTYLSRAINEISDQNFNNYLNQYRIEEACRLLTDHKGRNMTIEGIAQTVGFNSKSTFNTAFRKFKSVTPSEYMMMQVDNTQDVVEKIS